MTKAGTQSNGADNPNITGSRHSSQKHPNSPEMTGPETKVAKNQTFKPYTFDKKAQQRLQEIEASTLDEKGFLKRQFPVADGSFCPACFYDDSKFASECLIFCKLTSALLLMIMNQKVLTQ